MTSSLPIVLPLHSPLLPPTRGPNAALLPLNLLATTGPFELRMARSVSLRPLLIKPYVPLATSGPNDLHLTILTGPTREDLSIGGRFRIRFPAPKTVPYN